MSARVPDAGALGEIRRKVTAEVLEAQSTVSPWFFETIVATC